MKKQIEDSYEEYFMISPGEWVVIALGAIVFVLNLCGLIFVIYHRDYPPLKIKQIPLVSLNLIGMFFFFF